MQFKSFRAPVHGNNPTIFFNDDKEAIISDPYFNCDEMNKFIIENDLTIKAIIITHGHSDHAIGVAHLPKAPVYLHRDEAETYFAAVKQGRKYGIYVDSLPDFVPFDTEKTYELVKGIFVSAICVSGHSPAHLIYTIADECGPKFLLTGDMISANRVPGMYKYSYDIDLHNEGVDRIKALDLPDGVLVIPGHSDFTTFAEVKLTKRAVKDE